MIIWGIKRDRLLHLKLTKDKLVNFVESKTLLFLIQINYVSLIKIIIYFCVFYLYFWYLDMHLWRQCPMLYNCPNCANVVEISTL